MKLAEWVRGARELREGVADVGLFGTRILLSDDMRVLKRIEEIYDGHEFILFSLDHWIGMEVQLDRLSGGAVYLDKRLRERKNGTIVFDWGVSDFIKQTNTPALNPTINYQNNCLGLLIDFYAKKKVPQLVDLELVTALFRSLQKHVNYADVGGTLDYARKNFSSL